MMNFCPPNREDHDNSEERMESAANTRRFFRKSGYEGSGELGRMLLNLEAIASPLGVNERLDYDDDFSDVDNCHW